MNRNDPIPCDTCSYEDHCRKAGMCCPVFRHWTSTSRVVTKRRRMGGDNELVFIEQIPDRPIA